MFILKNPNVFMFTVMLDVMVVHVHIQIQIPITYIMCKNIYQIQIFRIFVQHSNAHKDNRTKNGITINCINPLSSRIGPDSSLHTHFWIQWIARTKRLIQDSDRIVYSKHFSIQVIARKEKNCCISVFHLHKFARTSEDAAQQHGHIKKHDGKPAREALSASWRRYRRRWI